MRGVQVAVLVLCFALSVGILSGLGVYNDAGVHVAPGMEGDVDTVEKDMADEDFTLDDTGGVFGFFDLAKSAIDSVKILWVLITAIESALMALGVPAAFASAIQTLASILFGITLIAIVRGINID